MRYVEAMRLTKHIERDAPTVSVTGYRREGMRSRIVAVTCVDNLTGYPFAVYSATDWVARKARAL